jgi:hypothetical protein
MKRSVLGLALLLPACLPIATPTAGGMGTIEIEVVAGPVCPVEQEPPDPNCEPRAVEGARIFVQPGDGRDILVGEATADQAGHATIEIAPGDYIVVGGDVEGLMGRPEPAAISVVAGQTATITLTYDTGIR